MPNTDLVENNRFKKVSIKNKIFRILLVFIFVLTLFFSNTSISYASDRYWVGGSGNWSDASYWSDSDSGIGGFSVPTSTDNVFFSAGSFSADGAIVTLDTIANTASLDFSGIDQAVIFSSSVNSINIYGALILPETNLTWTFTGTAYVYLKATTSVNITMGETSGRNFNRLYFDGVNGMWTSQDEMNIGGNIIHANGTWNTYDNTVTISGNYSTATGTKTLTLGSSVFTILGWEAYNTGFTFNSQNSTVRITGSNNFRLTYGSYSWNNVIFTNCDNVGINWPQTFVNLTCIGSNSVTSKIYTYNNLTITGTLTLTGYNATNSRLLVAPNVVGSARTLTAANIVASNVDFRDIVGAGSANWDLSEISGGSGDAGGNSGITFTPAVPQYFKHTSGAVNWSDSSKWFSDQAKTIPGRVPLPQDDATFDESSFTGASTLSVNVPRIGRSLDMSRVNQAVTMNISNTIESYGSFIIKNDNVISYGQNRNLYLLGIGDFNFSMNDTTEKTKTFSTIYFYRGTYTLLSHLITGYGVNIYTNFDANDYNMIDIDEGNGGGIVIYSGNIYMGNGNWIINDCRFEIIGGNIYPENSTVIFYKNTAGDLSYGYVSLNNKAINNIIFKEPSISGTLTRIITNGSFNNITIEAGNILKFVAGKTISVNSLTAVGTETNPITITSVTNDTHTLTYTGSLPVVFDYANISYSNATPANTWYASNSIDGSNNVGWTFANAPDAPTNIIPTAGNTEVSLSWTAPISDGGTAITDYVVEYKLTTDSTWSIFADAISTLTTGTIIGLSNSKSYDFRVYAVNNVGQGSASEIASATPFSPNDRYWIGGTGNWSDTSHWSNVDGGTGGQAVPTSTNDVYFSAGSLSADGAVVTLDTIANTASLDFSGIDQTMTFLNSVNTLNVYGSLSLSTNLSVSFTDTAYLYFKSTSTGNTITSNGNTSEWNGIYFDGVGGEWINQDDWILSRPNTGIGTTTIRLTNGTWNTNNKTIGFRYMRLGSGTKTWTLGSSTIYLMTLDFSSNTTGLIFNSGTSTIDWYISFYGGGFTFYDLVSHYYTNSYKPVSNVICHNFTFIQSSYNNHSIQLLGYLTVLNDLTLTGKIQLNQDY